MKLLLYCTKAKPYLADFKGDYQIYSNGKELDELFNKGFNPNDIMNILNGKIVAECDFDVEKIEYYKDYNGWLWYTTKSLWENRLQYLSCLSANDLENYLGDKGGYAIHIKNLHIFDKPKELSEYGMDFPISPIEKAPQNMMYANGIGERYILISIRPEWLCKILNGEKTIEVRKKVLKEML